MKRAAKKWWNYLLIALGVAIIVGLGIGLYYIINGPTWPKQYCWYFMIFAGIFLAMFGFVIQDLYRGWKRHKMNDWKNPLPEEIVDKAWAILFPMVFSGLISFLIGLIAFLITK